MQAYHEAIPTYLQDRNEAIVVLAADAGLRAGELCGLDVEHVDLEAGTVYLPTAIQKGSPPPATLSGGPSPSVTGSAKVRSAVR